MKQARSELALIDERLGALTQQIQALQADREVASMQVAAAEAAVEAMSVTMPERPLYPPPARTVSQIGMPIRWLDAAVAEVNADGSPIH